MHLKDFFRKKIVIFTVLLFFAVSFFFFIADEYRRASDQYYEGGIDNPYFWLKLSAEQYRGPCAAMSYTISVGWPLQFLNSSGRIGCGTTRINPVSLAVDFSIVWLAVGLIGGAFSRRKRDISQTPSA